MMHASWKGVVLARSDQTVVVDGNHYFPEQALDMRFFRPSATETVCAWKGTASYFDVVVENEVNADAAWIYRHPKPAAKEIRGAVAFWKGVEVKAASPAP